MFFVGVCGAPERKFGAEPGKSYEVMTLAHQRCPWHRNKRGTIGGVEVDERDSALLPKKESK